MSFRPIGLVIALFAIAALVAACGGGATESGQVPPPSSTPLVHSANDSVTENVYRERGAPAPVNDDPFDLTFFENYGVNPYISTEDDRFSTFAMDVDTASYTVARSYLNSGNLPPKASIRVEEFVNYFEQGYPPAEGTFRIHLDGAQHVFGEDNKHLLRVGIQSRSLTAATRRSANLTFVIDVSGSMDLDNRLGLAKRSLLMLVGQLRADDEVGIVVYGSSAREVLELTSDKNVIRSAVNGLSAGGSTYAEEGLNFGYRMATDAFDEDKINRVILVSDGVANVGKTGADSILKSVKSFSNNQITLTTIGVGMENYNDVLMEKLANHGDGSYFYLDTDDEAAQLFGPGLPGLLEIVASDAKIQVEFNPEVVDRYRLIGYENRAIADEDFRDDTVDAGEVGAGHTVTALYELRVIDGADGEVGTVRVRHEDLVTHEVEEIRSTVTAAEIDRPFREGVPRLRFAAAIAEFAELLRESPWAEDGTLDDVLAEPEAAIDELEATERDRDFIASVELAIGLSPNGR